MDPSNIFLKTYLDGEICFETFAQIKFAANLKKKIDPINTP
jgi:hypothetical protein